jgi:hypothetical protein
MSRLIPPAAAMHLYKQFHGREPTTKEIGGFYDPATLVPLGQAIAVIYRSRKLNGGGDGKRADYIHEFETPAALFADERAGKQLYIIGPQIVVTDAGIEN